MGKIILIGLEFFEKNLRPDHRPTFALLCDQEGRQRLAHCVDREVSSFSIQALSLGKLGSRVVTQRT